MKDLDIKWEDAPSDSAVWIVHNKGVNPSEWYSEEDDKGRYFRVSNPGIGYSRKAFVCNAITVHHRPEQPIPSKAEWMPSVGEECLGNIRNDMGKWSYVEVTPLYQFESEWAVAVNGSSILSYCDEFRPLKTTEEKKREAFIEEAKKIARTTDDALTHDRLFGLLFDNGAGFTAPSD